MIARRAGALRDGLGAGRGCGGGVGLSVVFLFFFFCSHPDVTVMVDWA